MAKGQKIDELYISLGLDIARLQLDFDTAGKTVSETVSRLNSQNYQLKLKTDIDLAKLEGAGRELDRLKVKYEAVNRQLDIQRQKEEILANVLKAAQKTDPDGSHTRYAASNLLRQQKEVAQLEAELRKLTAQMKTAGMTGRSMGEKITVGLDAAKSGVSRLSSGFSLLSAKTAAFLAVCTTGAGLFNITHDAMQAGENIYRLTQRLHTTSAEAAQLSRVFSLAGTSIDGVIPLFARLDKQVSAAGEDGNAMTEALTRFGVTLTNETGQLLPLNEQLAQLARGYKNAAAAGEEEAFTAEVLGARGAALIPVLEQYDDLMEISSHVKTTGLLNPEEAHAAYLKWREMEMEAGQLRLALGSALATLAVGQWGHRFPQRRLLLQPLLQVQRLGMAPQGEAPQRQALLVVMQLQRADAAMVEHAQHHARLQGPALPRRRPRRTCQQTLGRKGHQAAAELQRVGEVNRQGGLDVLLGSELGAQFGAQPGFRQPLKDTRGVH